MCDHPPATTLLAPVIPAGGVDGLGRGPLATSSPNPREFLAQIITTAVAMGGLGNPAALSTMSASRSSTDSNKAIASP
ncbi:uncharacterized protein N7459_008799 [Penicillium hispanicum]|uniref:uncharacterized protein n=1 Tax=Penicillium hispanicum TaxID=1080232 RepID=UPI002541F789|nr:uncharacterized protein N7459_008799 [Penicillium hispanicum]KAJ5574372.1 hypothetical protein N7459_008799 [Penicillium hispanicum]